ncbi:MAG: hypothetical protein ABEN55_09535 [Bradymonadaceae bacterium]
MDTLRAVGYALEGPLGEEVRARRKSDLVDEIVGAVDQLGEEAEPILEEHGLLEEPRVIELLAHYPTSSELHRHDILVEPTDEAPPLVQYRQLPLEEARELVELGRARWNREYSQEALE